MRSSFLRSARLWSHSVTKPHNLRPPFAWARWNSRSSSTGRQWSTPLAKILGEAITTTGPIPVASYMRQCLTSDLGGYYTASPPDRDQFGAKGDFVTSPEISQVFGELVGLWVVAEWIAQGRKSKGVHLIEVGPGRGTLMDDVLRTIRNFPDLVGAIDAIYLVEASPSLRAAQHQFLCGDHALEESATGHQSYSKHNDKLRVVWCEDLRLLPEQPEQTPFILAHEFFDALPIHVFQSIPPNPDQPETINTPTGPTPLSRTAKGPQWRELLVCPTAPSFQSNGDTALDGTDFELTLSKAATPHSMYLPEQSRRYTSLKTIPDSIIEVSPESHSYASAFAMRINDSGAALIIDYGTQSSVPANSLRGIKQHQRVSPFVGAGTVDLSADVDFIALAEAALNASPSVEVHGPVSQATWLRAMGIEARAAQLVKRAMETQRGKKELSDTVSRIEGGWRRLVDKSPQGMGALYQVMAIVPHNAQKLRRPVGFGGDVQFQ